VEFPDSGLAVVRTDLDSAAVEDTLVDRVTPLKHVLVREYVRGLVEDAEPGAAAPSERELVQRFGVARMTVRQAMDALVGEGLLQRSPGRGTFVAQPRSTSGRLTGFSEDMARRGLTPGSRTLLSRTEKAGPGVARALALTPGDPVIHWKRLRRADDEPMCVEDAFLSEVLLPGFLKGSPPASLYDALERRGLRPTWAEDSIKADGAGDEEAASLGVEPGSPVLVISRRALCHDKAIEVSRSTYRADRFTAWMQFTTQA
jgi:GntR family transcriptional regulator